MAEIHQFHHHAMATYYEVRIVHQDKNYAAQSAQSAFDLLDKLESQLSRFRASSDIAQAAQLAPGETMRLSEPAYTCLAIAKKMEAVTHGAFSATPAALQTQPALPQWSLLPQQQSIRCDTGTLQFDLGAIGKGFALDCMGELLREWDCPSFLLVAGGSSILAGDPPDDTPGWSCGLGDDGAPQRFYLSHASLSGSGIAVKGSHILDPRTGHVALRQSRAWALTDTAAESDALSTSFMVLTMPEVEDLLKHEPSWLAFFETESALQIVGIRAPLAPA